VASTSCSISDFRIIRKIGTGRASKVYHVQYVESGQELALKCYVRQGLTDAQTPEFSHFFLTFFLTHFAPDAPPPPVSLPSRAVQPLARRVARKIHERIAPPPSPSSTTFSGEEEEKKNYAFRQAHRESPSSPGVSTSPKRFFLPPFQSILFSKATTAVLTPNLREPRSSKR
jgi:hypothetical protein